MATAAGITGAIVTVEDQPYTATSNPGGSYELIIPVPGTYNIFCNHPDYQQAKINAVEVTLGINTKLDIQLTQ